MAIKRSFVITVICYCAPWTIPCCTKYPLNNKTEIRMDKPHKMQLRFDFGQSAFNFCIGILLIKSLAIAKGLGKVLGVCSSNQMHRLALSKERCYFFFLMIFVLFSIVKSMLWVFMLFSFIFEKVSMKLWATMKWCFAQKPLVQHLRHRLATIEPGSCMEWDRNRHGSVAQLTTDSRA